MRTFVMHFPEENLKSLACARSAKIACSSNHPLSFFWGGDSMSFTAEELLNYNTAERLLREHKQSKTSFWDRVFEPKHKLKALEKRTKKSTEKIERKEYYP